MPKAPDSKRLSRAYPWMRDYDEYIPIDRRGRCALDVIHNIIYLNTPRAASSSCKTVMEALGGKLCNHFEERVNLDEYFTFAIIRDPVARFISTFLFLSAGTRAMEYGTYKTDFYTHPALDAVKMDKFITEIEKDYWDPHTQPYCWWLTDKDFNLVELDHIFIADHDLAPTFESVFRSRLSIDLRFPCINSQPTEAKRLAERLLADNPRFLHRIKTLYACDFELYHHVKEM